jgi:hypothetical protein
MNSEQRPLTPKQTTGLKKVMSAGHKYHEAMLANVQLALDTIPEAESKGEAARYKVLAAWFQRLAREIQATDDKLRQILERGTCSPDEWRAHHVEVMRLTAEGEAITAELEARDPVP